MRNISFRISLFAVTLVVIFFGWTAWGLYAGKTAAETPMPRPAVMHVEESRSVQPVQAVSPALASLEKRVQEQAERLHQLEQEQNMPERISREAAPSVGLIIGDYIWTDRTGRIPLRYQGFDNKGNYLRDKDGQELVTFDGDGPIVVREFQGTGFLLDSGRVMTSGFILAPWYADPLLDESDNPEIIPSLRTIHGYFPGVAKAVNLKIDRATESGDAVLCSLDATLPAHGLAFGHNFKIQTGESVVLLGYPGGVDMLTLRIPDDLRHEIYKFGRTSLDETAELLAKNGYIQPIVMKSRISGQNDNRIFFETMSSVGNTGGPLMNSSGDVVGMSQSVHPNYPSFNMGLSAGPLRLWVTQAVSQAR